MRITVSAGIVFAAVFALAACTANPHGLVMAEESDGITFARATGDSDWPDMYYSARFTVGADDCLYVSFDGGDTALVVLNDDTQVSRDGLEVVNSSLIPFGQQVDVLRPNADYFDSATEGLDKCNASKRAGIRFGHEQ